MNDLFKLKSIITTAGIAMLMLLTDAEVKAQQILTLENAITTTVEYNYGIRLAGYEKEISDLQNHPGYAGMLPSVNATATYNTELSNTEQRYFSGDTRSETNAGSTLFEGGIYLNYTIFDGLGMYATKDKLEELAAMGELQLRQQVEETVFQLMTTWYQLVQLQYAEQVMDSAIVISNERYSIAKAKEQLGAGSGLDVLQALVDLNADSSSLLNIRLQIANSKAAVNQLMGRDPGIDFSVADVIAVDHSITLQQVRSNAEINNVDVLIAQKDQRIIDLEVREFKSYLYPTLSLTGGYGYLKSTSEAGFVESNLSYGPSVGLTLSVPLFNGFTVNRDLDVAGLYGDMSRLQLQETQLVLDTYLTTLYNQYTTSLYLTGLEERNVIAARSNVAIALEKYDVGSITAVDLREIQQTQIEAENRLLLETLNAKLAELQLKKLSGNLLKN